jgi:hypothetical protein
MIFACPPQRPPSIRPSRTIRHELYLMCDDLEAETAALHAGGVDYSEADEVRQGSITKIWLPGRDQIGLYQPRHPRP